MRALVLHPIRTDGAAAARREPADALAEAVSLAEALSLDVVAAEAHPLPKARAGTLFGSGRVEAIAEQVREAEIGLVIVDGQLSPVQQRNLEKAWDAKVLDRTGLILEIFGDRAHTREGVLQVELAHLNYQKSRLVRSWTHLERQRGGTGFLGGPGETQLESDRRALNDRIIRIRHALEKVVRTRGTHRAARKRAEQPVVALVGYTNSGKSTLFNRLTGAGVLAQDMLFATLDPTMRAMELPGGTRAILSDTVGFIADLPTQLVAAFRATLEDVRDADLILHIRDITHVESAIQSRNVLGILNDLGIETGEDARIIEVWNKIDLLPATEAETLGLIAARTPGVIAISAATGQGVDALLKAIEQAVVEAVHDDTLRLGFDQGLKRAWLFDHKLVSAERQTDAGYELEVRWSDRDRDRYHRL